MRKLAVLAWIVVAAVAVGAPEPENIAFEKPVWTNGGIGQGAPELLVDGKTESNPYLGGPTEVEIDFENTYRVNMVKIWHYWEDGRTYTNNIVALSETGLFGGEEVVVFDSNVDGEYPETAEGKTITFDPIDAGFLHAWVGGSDVNQWSHWVEIQVFFDPKLLDVEPKGKLATKWGSLKADRDD